MQRMDRYREVLAGMVRDGKVYPCYMSVAELDALRERQMANKEKPRYDGTWRPAPGKTLPPVPEGVQPVLRFMNPTGGVVAWTNKVKGRIEISNDELDDLVIARPDGTPTYNFCVVVDDIDMRITHVIRGDDHVNNTPRQINIFRALGYEPPVYAHLPTVLNEQGEKMSKRSGAKPVTQYRDEGFLPDAMINYLARLGWSHATPRSSAASSSWPGSTWITWARARRSSTRPSCAGSMPSTSRPWARTSWRCWWASS